MQLVPNSLGTALREFNHCHGEHDGKFCSDDGRLQVSDVQARAAKITAEATTSEERTYARQLAVAELLMEQDALDGDTKDTYTRGGVYTPERAALHDRIIQQYFEDRAKADGQVIPRGLEHPKALLMAGVPAAGKSTAMQGMALKDHVLVNSDVMKSYLPGYDGRNQIEYQRESADLAARVTAFAVANRMNVLIDRTQREAGQVHDPLGVFDGMLGQLAAYKAAGYTTEVRFVKIPVDVSIARSIRRFLDPKEEGRYMPGPVIRGLFLPDGTSRPEQSVRLALATSVNGVPLVDTAWIFDGVTHQGSQIR